MYYKNNLIRQVGQRSKPFEMSDDTKEHKKLGKDIIINHFIDGRVEEIISKKIDINILQQNQNDVTDDLSNRNTVKFVDIDDILKSIGDFGKAQMLILFFLCLMLVPTVYHTMSWYFTGHSPAWRCIRHNGECNLTGVFDVGDNFYESRCSMKRDSWEFVEDKSYSVVTEWDLICEKKEYPFIANTLMWVGFGLGAFVFGCLADRFGRKLILFIAWTGILLATFACSISTHFWLFASFAFVVGLCGGGAALVIPVMVSELVGPKYKSLTSGTGLSISVTIALCMLSVQAWLLTNWRHLLMVTSAPYLILLCFVKVIPKSVRWLRLKNQLDEAERILQSICKFNGRKWPSEKMLSPPKPGDSNAKKISEIVTYKRLTIGYAFQCIIWFVIGQVFYGMLMAADQLGGNIFRDSLLVNLVQLPGSVIMVFLTNRFGRRPTMIGGFALSSLSCIVVALIAPNSSYVWGRISAGLFGMFCMSIVFATMYVWSMELLPTVVRSQGMGFLSVMARVGAGSAPWVAQWLKHIHHILPFAVMAAFAFIASLSSSRLMETKSVPTMETLEDTLTNSSKKTKELRSTHRKSKEDPEEISASEERKNCKCV